MHVWKYNQPNFQIRSEKEQNHFLTNYEKIEETASKILANANYEIYCLQEVRTLKRPLIDFLKKKGYRIVCYQNQKNELCLDTAIAIDIKRFDLIQNASISFEHKGSAIALLKDKITKKKVVIASLHAPGFQFTHEKLTEDEIKPGRESCRQVLHTLSKVHSSCHKIVCADMNATPEKIGVERFQLFSKAGYQLLRTHRPTNVNMRDESENQRELDYIFYKLYHTFAEKVKSLVFKQIGINGKILKQKLLKFDKDVHFSDHLPIVAQFQIPQ